MGVALIHRFYADFPLQTIHFWDTPFSESSIYTLYYLEDSSQAWYASPFTPRTIFLQPICCGSRRQTSEVHMVALLANMTLETKITYGSRCVPCWFPD